MRLKSFVGSCMVLLSTCATCVCEGDIEDKEAWLEIARSFALEFCVPFYDEEYGEYEISSKDNKVLYIGAFKLYQKLGMTEIYMSMNGDLVQVYSGGTRVHPEAEFYPFDQESECREYQKDHDEFGRLLPEYRPEYQQSRQQ